MQVIGSQVFDGRIRGFGGVAALFQVIAAGSVTAIRQPWQGV